MRNPSNDICLDAIVAYITEGKPLFKTIRECRDIRKLVTVRTVKGGAVWNVGEETVERISEKTGRKLKPGVRYLLDDAEWEPKAGAEAQIMNRLSDIMYSLDEQDVADVPEMINVPVKVTLPSKVLKEYQRFERTLISQVYDVEAVNRGVLHMKLMQFANGSMYQEDGKDVWIHDEKLSALEQIIDEANGMPVLVAYTFKFDLARIRRAFKEAVVWGESDVRKTKERWNKGGIELMLAHPNSIGHGQNIQHGGHISVWYGLTPDLELYQQFNKRLHRPGQTNTVRNHHIIAKGTYDEDIIPILTDRSSTQARINKSVRVRLSTS